MYAALLLRGAARRGGDGPSEGHALHIMLTGLSDEVVACNKEKSESK